MLRQRRIIDDYKELAINRSFEYILNIIPNSVDTPIEGWKCKSGHVWKASYTNIKKKGCPVCSNRIPKTLKDYKEMAISKEFKYEKNTIPKTTSRPTDGWTCKIGHKWRTTYGSIQQGTGCPTCSNRIPKTLDNYKNLAINRGFTFILNILLIACANNVLTGKLLPISLNMEFSDKHKVHPNIIKNKPNKP